MAYRLREDARVHSAANQFTNSLTTSQRNHLRYLLTCQHRALLLALGIHCPEPEPEKTQSAAAGGGEAGFSLLEMLVVIAITLILLAAAVPSAMQVRRASQISAARAEAHGLYTLVRASAVCHVVTPSVCAVSDALIPSAGQSVERTSGYWWYFSGFAPDGTWQYQGTPQDKTEPTVSTDNTGVVTEVTQ